MFDRLWVKRILKGDRAEGERFVSAHYPRLYRWLRNLCGDVEVAQDLTQQTFARAWQTLPGYRGEARLATWLHRIAYHEYTHWLRDRRECVGLECAADLVDLRAVQGLKTVLLRHALAKLPTDQRETFLLYYVQELSVHETALVLDVPAGTVKSRLFAARKRLRELLDESQTEPVRPSPLPIVPTAPTLIKEALSNGLATSHTRHDVG